MRETFSHVQLSWRGAQSGCASVDDPEEEMVEEVEWEDDGSLPLEKDGGLPFYFLDAHEEPHVPHTVYLFGKVVPYWCLRSETVFFSCPPCDGRNHLAMSRSTTLRC
jgi:hypothetical protein